MKQKTILEKNRCFSIPKQYHNVQILKSIVHSIIIVFFLSLPAKKRTFDIPFNCLNIFENDETNCDFITVMKCRQLDPTPMNAFLKIINTDGYRVFIHLVLFFHVASSYAISLYRDDRWDYVIYDVHLHIGVGITWCIAIDICCLSFEVFDLFARYKILKNCSGHHGLKHSGDHATLVIYAILLSLLCSFQVIIFAFKIK